ncbi:MAG: hypothetical protein Q3M24_04585 [Candidatus Electrothrix aestuarii]|uniref:Lipoprotein n=1 Tax=Candidatus Electrothrix aestuarii TaxID=3062594 RepID=A0AAU8LYZ9_9BACT|nr:hypothetical protein [Candidatus Electrothrix aestuarii]
MKKLFILCVCLVMLVACAQNKQPEDYPQTVELQSHASKKVSNDLSIRFNSVLEDSRCPTGAQCAWEGNAEILLELSGGDLETVHLNTGAQFPRTEVYNGYVITLEDLKPHPTEGVAVQESDYTAVLSIDLEAEETSVP